MKNLAGTAVRLIYLDWIRVLSILGVFLFHNARFFDQFGDWHVKNATTNIAASAWVAFMSQWIMPLFFVIAGAGTFYALESRKASQFARERILRLLVPLIFGMLVIVVPQAYFQAVSHGQPFGGSNPFQVYVEYVKTLPQGNAFHLWFLDDLFIFSIIALPILVPLKGGRSVISRLASFFNNSWVLTTILVSCLAAVDVFLFPGGFLGSTSSGGWNFVAYALFFVSGCLIFANVRIMESIRKSAWILLSVGIAAMVCLMALFINEIADPLASFGTTRFALAHITQALSTWCWLLAMLGLASKYLNANNRFLAYSNEAVLPFYVLHQTVIVSIGFYVVQWSSGVGIKYLTISTTSFIAVMLVCELLVRRINVLRFLFGMRSKKRLGALAMQSQS